MITMTSDKIKAVILGHAVADALGVPAEFCTREELDEAPITTMEGFGTYPYPAGSWSDDTSMSIAALDSLARGHLNYDEIMFNFCKWYYKDEYTPTGELFDAGYTCCKAIENYFELKLPFGAWGEDGERSNGNGSLMRIHPFVLYAKYGNFKGDFLQMIYEASALTHAHRRSEIGCGIYAIILKQLLDNPSKESILQGLRLAKDQYESEAEFPYYGRIFADDFATLDRSEIKSGGYIVHTLEAALWCLLTTDSYAECVLKAVNLGDDTDTVAAVAGGLTGALYGLDSIPQEWISTLLRRDYIEGLCERACDTWLQNENGDF